MKLSERPKGRLVLSIFAAQGILAHQVDITDFGFPGDSANGLEDDVVFGTILRREAIPPVYGHAHVVLRKISRAQLLLELVVRGRHNDGVRVRDCFAERRCELILIVMRDLAEGDVRVVRADERSFLVQVVDERKRWRVADIINILLVRESEYGNNGFPQRTFDFVQPVHYKACSVCGHPVVDTPGRAVEVHGDAFLVALVYEIPRVNRDAVASDACSGARILAEKAEMLGFHPFDDAVQVDAALVAEGRDLADARDDEIRHRILEHLDEFRFLDAAHRVDIDQVFPAVNDVRADVKH